MLHEIIAQFEAHILLFIIGHTLISLVFGVIAARYLAHRFPTNDKKSVENDLHRLELVQYSSWIFRQFHKVSLHKHNHINIMIFVFLMSFSMPLIGIFITSWFIFFLKIVKYAKKAAHTGILDLNEFENTFNPVERIFGEGSMVDMMNNPYVPKRKKVMALSSLANSLTPTAVSIIKETLKSSDDEIRLYGYAVINKAEDKLGKKLSHQLELYNENDGEIKADAAKELAFLYWEMVYSELAHDTLKESFIAESKKFLQEAKEFYKKSLSQHPKNIKAYKKELKKLRKNENIDEELEEYYLKKIETESYQRDEMKIVLSKMSILEGRILMWQKKPKEAIIHFQEAYELDKSSFIVPYLAESYFAAAEFKKVKEILHQVEDLKFNEKLAPIMQQWGIQ